MEILRCFFILLLLLLVIQCANGRDFTFTFQLPAGREECFYDYIHEGALLELEYQVIEGGELDINFKLLDPDSKVIYSDFRSMDGLHSFDIKHTGEYAMCFDNTFSRLSHKSVYFDIIIEDDEGDNEDDDLYPHTMSNDAIILDMTVQDLRKILSSLSQNLNKVALSQQFFRAREARHRYSLESSNSRVMSWSTVNCVVMLGVGILQVYLIRKLFRSHRQDKIKT